jgi:hypothetical protein
MKKIYRYLKALGRPEKEISKKFNLSTIVNFRYSTPEQKQCVLNVVGRGEAYSEMNFDGMIQASKDLERIFKFVSYLSMGIGTSHSLKEK